MSASVIQEQSAKSITWSRLLDPMNPLEVVAESARGLSYSPFVASLSQWPSQAGDSPQVRQRPPSSSAHRPWSEHHRSIPQPVPYWRVWQHRNCPLTQVYQWTLDLGPAIGIYLAAVFTGPIAGPIVGSLVTESLNWRGTIWTSFAVGTAFTLFGIFVIPESSEAVLLQRKAVKFRFETEDGALHSKLDRNPLSSFLQGQKMALCEALF